MSLLNKCLFVVMLVAILQGCSRYRHSMSANSTYVPPTAEEKATQQAYYAVEFDTAWLAVIQVFEKMNLPISDLNIKKGEILAADAYQSGEQEGIVLMGSEVLVKSLKTNEIKPGGLGIKFTMDDYATEYGGKLVGSKTQEVSRENHEVTYRTEVVYVINILRKGKGVEVKVSTRMKGLALVAGVQPAPISTGQLEKDFIKRLTAVL